jgi:hypothetical protein
LLLIFCGGCTQAKPTLRDTYSGQKQARSYDFAVSSIPSGADIFIDGKYEGVTPRTVRAHFGVHSIEIRKHGYQTHAGNYWLDMNDTYIVELEKSRLGEPGGAPPTVKPHAEAQEEKPEASLLSSISEKDTTPPRIYLFQRGIEIVASAQKTLRGQAVDESGVALVYVNKREAQIDANGNFQAEILLKPGLNNVVIEAFDIHNNKATKKVAITRKTQAAERQGPREGIFEISGTYYALVIGINSYRHLESLQTAVNDAEEVGRILRDSYGFETTLLINQNATRRTIVSELNRLRQELSSEDKLLIYYAGHGYFDEHAKKAYWLPVDAEKSNDTNWIMAERITSNLKRIPAKHILVVSDSCYSGTLTRAAQVDLFSTATRVNYINKILNKQARVLIASGGNEPVTDTGGVRHSVFAQAFLRALREVDREVFLAEELFVGYIKEPVAGKADQTPQYSLIRNSGHDGGDFIFMKRSF